jgi:hypothetical protein
MHYAPVVDGLGIIRLDLDGASEIRKGAIVVALLKMSNSAVV